MFTVSEELIKNELKFDDICMITVSLSYPSVSGGNRKAARRISRYYKGAAEAMMKYVKRSMLPLAIAEYKASIENSFPFREYSVNVTYTVTQNDEGVFSLYSDKYVYTGGAHGNTTRRGDTWDAATGWFIELSEFFPRGTRYKKLLTENAARIAARQIAAGTHTYFEDYPALIKKHFKRQSFYTAPGTVTIFYGQYEIAPYVEGIPVFPYKLNNTAE